MADNYNSMQANLGLIPGSGPQMQVKSPAQAAAELSAQASAQMQAAQQMMPVVRSSTASFTFGQQYQQQFQSAQSQSNMSPYSASVLGAFTQPSALPSPMMMTPASTGVFRSPPPYGSGGGGSPMSPMAVMPMFQTPFTPQLPAPNFRTPWEQEIQQRELRSDQYYAMTSQAPRFGGQTAGYGVGAMAGAALGSRFGAVGRGAGAVLGGLLSHYSGFAEGMGAVSMMPFRPGREAHEMGLSAQRMSQDWVVGGPNLHELGRGLSRDASMYVGQGIQRLSESQSFKNETGGKFNRHDLTQILQKSGQAGLMDFDQGVDRIQEQLRKVSRTVSRFMELTNDPDVTSVIKRMGQMHTFGLSVPEIENAASSMRSFSRAAGTTVNGLYQQGLPGAMTYQNLGLSGGAGLQYGMYSAAAAKQAVASGTFSNAELAMFGGVQGVAQRNMQAQGAFMSMPMFGASISSYGAGGWGMNAGALAGVAGGGRGPQGMVMGAVSNMNAALGAGGIGALAMMPLQQRQIQDEAARTLSPYAQTAMRFSMAADTGKFLGLKGAGGFAAGARMLYGDEVATQMMTEAANPAYWRAQKQMIRQERDDIARSQRQEIMDAVPGVFSRIGSVAGGAVGRATDAITDPFSAAGGAIGRGWRDWVSRPLQEQRDRAAGIVTRDRLDPGMSADTSSKEGRAAYAARRKLVGSKGLRKSSDSVDISGRDAYDLWTTSVYGGDQHVADYTGAGLDVAMFGLTGTVGKVGTAALLGLGMNGIDTGEVMRGAIGSLYKANELSGNSPEAQAARSRARAVQKEQAWGVSRIEGSAGRTLSGGFKTGEYTALEKSLGLKQGQGAWAVHAAGREMASAAADASGVFIDDRMTSVTFKNAMVRSLAVSSGKSTADVSAALTGDAFDTAYEAAYASGRTGAGATAKSMFLKYEESAKGGVARSSMVATREEMEAIRTRKGQISHGLGLGSLSSDNAEELAKISAKYSPAQTLAIVYNNAKGLSKSQQSAWQAKIKERLAVQMGIKGPDDPRWAKLDEYAVNEIDRMNGVVVSDKLRGAMGEIALKQNGADLVTENIEMITREQMSERTSGVISTLNTAMERGTSEGVRDEEGLMSLSSGDIGLLRKKGFGKIAGILSKAEGASKDERAKILEQLRVEMDSMGSDAASQSLTTPTGEQARGLQVSEKSIENIAEQMAEAFKGFNAETTKSFKEGALALNDAMIALKARDGRP